MLCLREIATRSTGAELAQAASTYLGEQRRRSTRLDQTSPLIIRGVDLLGQPFEERTATQNFSFQGCRYASKHHLPKNTWVTLEAPSGDSRGEAVCVRARVAWIQRPRTLRELFQVGVELEKARNIWNVEFPPNDWNSEKTPELSIVRSASGSEGCKGSGKETSLEDYLRRATVFTTQEPAPFESGGWNETSGTLIGQLRQELLRQSEKLIEEAREGTEELIREQVGVLRSELQNFQTASAQALYGQCLKEFEKGRIEAKQEVASSVGQQVAAQLANFRHEVKETVAAEWTEKFRHAELILSQWQTEAQALRKEVRTDVETNLVRSDERLNEKLLEIRRELEAALSTKAAESKAAEAGEVQTDSTVANVGSDFDSARKQWNELVENSIESAAQRFVERVTSSSRQVLRNSEEMLARHAADLQKEAGITAEAARSTLDEMKSALEREISAAKNALKQIEQSASTHAEYPQQLEAASHHALDDLKSKLDSVVSDKFHEMEKRTTELEVKFAEHANMILGQQVGEVVSRNRQEIEANTATGLDHIRAAIEEFAAREESAENLLQIHRERLRQFAEQIQREAAARLSSVLALFENNLNEHGSKNLEQWKEVLETQTARARDEALNALAKRIESQLAAAEEHLAGKTEQSADSARERMDAELHIAVVSFQEEVEKRHANQLEKAAAELATVAQGQVQSATIEFRKAAEAAASALGEIIVEADAKALAKFSAEIDERTGRERAKLASSAESVLQRIQTHAQTSFEHFQEQLAIKSDLSMQTASDALTREMGLKMGDFHEESERMFAECRFRQESSFAQAFEKNRADLEAAANSVIAASLDQLQQHSQKRIGLASEEAEQAVHRACADVFETMAQKMREHVPGFGENTPSSPVAPMEQERHASTR